MCMSTNLHCGSLRASSLGVGGREKGKRACKNFFAAPIKPDASGCLCIWSFSANWKFAQCKQIV